MDDVNRKKVAQSLYFLELKAIFAAVATSTVWMDRDGNLTNETNSPSRNETEH